MTRGVSSASMETSTASMASAASALRLRAMRRWIFFVVAHRVSWGVASLAPQVLGQPHCHLRHDSTTTSKYESIVSIRELYPRKLFQTVWASGLQPGIWIHPVTCDLPHPSTSRHSCDQAKPTLLESEARARQMHLTPALTAKCHAELDVVQSRICFVAVCKGFVTESGWSSQVLDFGCRSMTRCSSVELPTVSGTCAGTSCTVQVRT